MTLEIPYLIVVDVIINRKICSTNSLRVMFLMYGIRVMDIMCPIYIVGDILLLLITSTSEL